MEHSCPAWWPVLTQPTSPQERFWDAWEVHLSALSPGLSVLLATPLMVLPSVIHSLFAARITNSFMIKLNDCTSSHGGATGKSRAESGLEITVVLWWKWCQGHSFLGVRCQNLKIAQCHIPDFPWKITYLPRLNLYFIDSNNSQSLTVSSPYGDSPWLALVPQILQAPESVNLVLLDLLLITVPKASIQQCQPYVYGHTNSPQWPSCTACLFKTYVLLFKILNLVCLFVSFTLVLETMKFLDSTPETMIQEACWGKNSHLWQALPGDFDESGWQLHCKRERNL